MIIVFEITVDFRQRFRMNELHISCGRISSLSVTIPRLFGFMGAFLLDRVTPLIAA